MSISRAIISVGLTALPQGIDAVRIGADFGIEPSSLAPVRSVKRDTISNTTDTIPSKSSAVTTGPLAHSVVWNAALSQAPTVSESRVQKVFDTFASSGV